MSLDEPISMFKKPNRKHLYYKIPAKNFPKCDGFSAYKSCKWPEAFAGPCKLRARYPKDGKNYCKKHLPKS